MVLLIQTHRVNRPFKQSKQSWLCGYTDNMKINLEILVLPLTPNPKHDLIGERDMIFKIAKKCYAIMAKDYRIFKIIFIIWGFYLVFEAFYIYLVKRPTYTSYEKRYINSEDIPDVIICPQPSIDNDAVRLKGYLGPRRYFGGLSESPQSQSLTQIGWVGNKSEDVKKVSVDISTLKSKDECPYGVFFIKDEEIRTYHQAAFELKRVLNPHHICCRLVPPSFPVQSMHFFISNNNSHLIHIYNLTKADKASSLPHSFQVFLADPKTASIFDQNKVNMVGDRIVSSPSNNGFMIYRVIIMEEKRLEHDPKYPCINYKIESAYSQCLEKELVSQSLKFLNCTPPWVTENEDLWCKEKIIYESISSKLKFRTWISDVTEGNYDYGTCLEPCRVKKYSAKEMVFKDMENISGVQLKFSNEISITKSSWKTTWSTLISKTGGFIGINKNFLWIVTLSISSMGVFVRNVQIRKNQHVVHQI